MPSRTMDGEAALQPAIDVNAASVMRLLVLLGVFGAFAARLVLRWAAGHRPFSGQTDDAGSASESSDQGWCGGDDGGACNGDGGH